MLVLLFRYEEWEKLFWMPLVLEVKNPFIFFLEIVK